MGKWAKYEKHYKKDWEKEEEFTNWLTEVKGNDKQARCKVCEVNLRAHKTDLLKHSLTRKHIALYKANILAGNLPPTSQSFDNITDMADKQRLMIIDTDSGIDDILAILLALDDPNWQVLAVTTVHGNVDVNQSTENALRVLEFVKKTEIPVYKGCDKALIKQFPSDNYHGEDGMSGCSYEFPLPEEVQAQPEAAAVALIRLIHEHPKEISLICLGPLTNIVVAQRLDRTFASNIKELFIMGGNREGIGNVTMCGEFNFMSDAEAADITLNEFTCPKTIITWEVCQEHTVPWEWFEIWISKQTKRSEFVKKLTKVPVTRSAICSHLAGFHCCDLLAMTAMLHPEIVIDSEQRHVRVETEGVHTRGLMVLERRLWSDVKPNARIPTSYDRRAIREIWNKLTD